jgi:NAD-dependent SIR2 family protein deacetylase
VHREPLTYQQWKETVTHTNREIHDSLQRAATTIASAHTLLITAGAGMGVDSGLPDFRGTDGFWNAYPPYRHLKLSFAELANPKWFRQDPEFAWGFYGHRLNLYRATTPHAGFQVLKKWAATKPTHVFTSNVDGHFAKSGFPENTSTEAHGSIHHLQCQACQKIWPAADIEITIDPATFRATGPLPTCPRCQLIARPNILMFNDDAWLSDRADHQAESLVQWMETANNKPTAIIECGAGTAVPTVRSFSESIASNPGATLIRINVREPQIPHTHIALPLGALEALTAIDALLLQ